MSESVFISVAQVEIIQARQIARYGGTQGIRDRGAMGSAVFQPQNIYFYANGDLHETDGYAYHIAEAPAFLDGNKRTAMGAALGFLESNGIDTRTATAELYAAMIAIAEKRMTRTELATLLRTLFPA